jgi:prephenate dehydrogenase
VSLPRRIVVVGAGLLGGSIVSALQVRRPFGDEDGIRIVAVSGGKTLQALRDRDWCDEHFTYDQLENACDEADLVVLCSPLSALQTHLLRLSSARDRLARGAVVTDVGSTKALVCRNGFAGFPDDGDGSPRFVGGHPMAGSEKSGIEAADPLLFQSALWVLCPPPDLPEGQDSGLRALVQTLGARLAVLAPRIHDAAVARISHAPQILSSALSAWAGRDDALAEPALDLAAGGFRDMTRLSLSRWEVWRDIVATNPGPIASALEELSVSLAGLATAARSWEKALDTFDDDPASIARQGRFFDAIARQKLEDASQILSAEGLSGDLREGERIFREAFQSGSAFRSRFRMPRKGIAHDLHEFVVRLEDRPGQLQALLKPLAEAGLNVQDLEILKVREGESGTVLLGFGTAEDAAKAREVLGNDRFLVMAR